MGVAVLPGRLEALASTTARVAAFLCGAVLLAVTLVAGLSLEPPSWLIVGACLALVAVFGLALLRLDAAVLLGFVVFGIVSFEPAPPDAVFAVAIAVALATGRFSVRAPLSICALIGVILALNFISFVEIVDARRATTFLLITVYLAVFSLWLSGYVDSMPRARLVAGAYVAGAGAIAALGLLPLFAHFPGSDFFQGYGYRAKASFKDPNVFGQFLVPASLILLEELIAPRLFGRRWWKVPLLAVTSAGILFSYSRSAWISAAIGAAVLLLVFAFRRGGARRALVLLMLGLVVGGALVATVALTDSIHSVEQRAHLQRYDTERFAAQETGIGLVGHYPFGIGPGQFERVSAVSAHSTYVRALAEQGVLGLVAVLTLMLVTLTFAARNVVLGRDTYGIGSGALLAAWAGILVSSLVIDTIHWRHLWLVAALIWAGTSRKVLRTSREQVH